MVKEAETDSAHQPPITSYKIVRVFPCMADYEKVRVIVEIEGNLAPLLPYLNALKKGAVYSPATCTLTVKTDGAMWTFQPDRVLLAKIEDEAEAHSLMAAFIEEAADIWRRRDGIEPCHERRNSLPAIEVFKLLPGNNCGNCGVPTCMAFAMKLIAGGTDISVCGPIFTPEWADRRTRLGELLVDSGYSVSGY